MGMLSDGVRSDNSGGKVRDVAKGNLKIDVKIMMTRKEVDMTCREVIVQADLVIWVAKCVARLTKHEDKFGLVASEEGQLVCQVQTDGIMGFWP